MNALRSIQAATEPVTFGITWEDVVHAVPTKASHMARARAAGGVKLPVIYSSPSYPYTVVVIIGRGCHAKIMDNGDSARAEFSREPLTSFGPAKPKIGKPKYFKYAEYRNAKVLLTAVLAEFIKRTGTGKKKATAAAEPAADVFENAVSALQPLTGSKFYIEDDRNIEWWLNRVILVGPGHLTLEFGHSFGPDSPKCVITYRVTTYTRGDLVEIEISSPSDARRGRNTPRKYAPRRPMPSTGPALAKLVLNHAALDLHATAVFRNGKLQYLPVTAAAEPQTNRNTEDLLSRLKQRFNTSVKGLDIQVLPGQGKWIVLVQRGQKHVKSFEVLDDKVDNKFYSLYSNGVHNTRSWQASFKARDLRDLMREVISCVVATVTKQAAKSVKAAAEPTPATDVIHAFCALVRSTMQPKTVKVRGREIKVYSYNRGLPTQTSSAHVYLDYQDSRYVLRTPLRTPLRDPSIVTVSPRYSTGAESSKYEKTFLHATSASDLLKQVIAHIMHVEAQNS